MTAATAVSQARMTCGPGDRHLRTLMDRFSPSGIAREGIAIALSGGADSTALLLLARDWTQQRGITLTGITVDHGLRPESPAEAARVAQWCEALGISHHTLRWKGERPASGIQEAARAARYGLISAWCHAHGVREVWLAHHRDDQVETYLYRKSRGSGEAGLACMSVLHERLGIRWMRPLLHVSGAELRDYLKMRGHSWIDDPSNHNMNFTRNRIRAGLLGQDTAEIECAIQKWQVRRAAAERASFARLRRHAVWNPDGGYGRISAALWRDSEKTQAASDLALLYTCLGTQVYPLRRAALLDHLARLRTGRAATLAGWLWFPAAKREEEGIWWVVRERAAAAMPGAPDWRESPLLWDGRYLLRWQGELPKGVSLRLLGQEGWLHVRNHEPVQAFSRLPARVRAAFSALFHLEVPVCVPHMQWCDASFASHAVTLAPLMSDPLARAPFSASN